VVCTRELGGARRRDHGQCACGRAGSNFTFASDTHYPLQLHDVLTNGVRIENGTIAVPHEPGLGVSLDPERVASLAGLELRESPFYDEIKGDAPRVGQIF